MEQKSLKWKDVYNENKKRRYCEITGINKENVGIESNSIKFLKQKKYIAIIFSLIVLVALIYTFRSDIKILLMVIAFFIFAGLAFFVFNYYKMECLKNGLYIRYGIQQGLFPYEKLKCVYLSKYNDYSFLIPAKRVYSIVIRYEDNSNRIRELSFPNYFLSKEETANFLSNFNIKEAEEPKYVSYEKFKVLKMIGKVILMVLFILFIFGLVYMHK